MTFGFYNIDALNRLADLLAAGAITYRDHAVGVILAGYMGDKDFAWPSIGKLAENLNTNERSISLAIQSLTNAGFLTSKQRGPSKSCKRELLKPRKESSRQASKESCEANGQASKDLCSKPRKKVANRQTQEPPDSPDLKNQDSHKANSWGWWVEANRDANRKDPARVGPDLKASKTLNALVSNGDLTEAEVRDAMGAYLADPDTWLSKQGHPLRLLPGRLNAYRNAPPDPGAERAAAAAERLRHLEDDPEVQEYDKQRDNK